MKRGARMRSRLGRKPNAEQLDLGADIAAEMPSPTPTQPSQEVGVETLVTAALALATSTAPTTAPTPPASVAVAEVAILQPWHLGELPRPTSLELAMVATGRAWAVTTSATWYAAARAARLPVFTGRELVALAVAAERGRASPVWLEGRLDARVDDPSVALELGAAVGGNPADFELDEGWGDGHGTYPTSPTTIGRVLCAWGTRLVRVGVGEEVEWLG